MNSETDIRGLISQLARLGAAEIWEGDFSPSQRAVLVYLARANRFSHSPLHVADSCGRARGTTSQSLKSLSQKGYVEEKHPSRDKRVIRYDLRPKGREAAHSTPLLKDVLGSMGKNDLLSLKELLTTALHYAVTRNDNQEFGARRTCIHNELGALARIASCS